MIDMDVLRVIEGNVMILIATRNEARRPMIGRASGVKLDLETGLLRILVSRSQWPLAVENARPGWPLACTFVVPNSYRAYQVKGMIQDVRLATEAENERGTAYVETMLSLLGTLGVTRLQLSSTLSDRDLVCIGLQPTDVFVQTPGPGAGKRLPDGEVPA